MKKLLFVFCHPDDESFATGGTIAKYVHAGWKVELICATKGERGETGPYPEDIDVAQVRQKELEQAADILKISTITYLDFIDGDMKDIPPGELEEQLYKLLSEKEPDVVVTFEPNGISNHPDHIKMCLSATFAFQKYARDKTKGYPFGSRDPRRYLLKTDEAKGNQEPKLYYICMPESTAEFLLKKNVLPVESFGKPWKGVADKRVTTVIDVSRFRKKKIEAIHMHKTQQKDVDRYLSINNNPLLTQEHYILRMHGAEEVFLGKGDRVGNKL